jgi:hypothetical protein
LQSLQEILYLENFQKNKKCTSVSDHSWKIFPKITKSQSTNCSQLSNIFNFFLQHPGYHSHHIKGRPRFNQIYNSGRKQPNGLMVRLTRSADLMSGWPRLAGCRGTPPCRSLVKHPHCTALHCTLCSAVHKCCTALHCTAPGNRAR